MDGDAAREEARDEATMALARESMVTEELTEIADGDVNLRFCCWMAARKEDL